MSDNILERVNQVLDWLIFIGYASNGKEIAEKLGYSKSSFSQIINGRVPLSGRFITKLAEVAPDINKVWIWDGVGDMFLNPPGSGNMDTFEPTNSNKMGELIQSNKNQSETILKLTETIAKLTDTISEISKKIH